MTPLEDFVVSIACGISAALVLGWLATARSWGPRLRQAGAQGDVRTPLTVFIGSVSGLVGSYFLLYGYLIPILQSADKPGAALSAWLMYLAAVTVILLAGMLLLAIMACGSSSVLGAAIRTWGGMPAGSPWAENITNSAARTITRRIGKSEEQFMGIVARGAGRHLAGALRAYRKIDDSSASTIFRIVGSALEHPNIYAALEEKASDLAAVESLTFNDHGFEISWDLARLVEESLNGYQLQVQRLYGGPKALLRWAFSALNNRGARPETSVNADAPQPA
ncbi:Uncharacterised protein [Mycobacteroides abscessus subsp. abscessus]|nr:Uncharacterised protein [Mycobacteroides abscessus subsp. abscessus]SID07982.1 Uncharacterised protein [Mycobacteroides abscessus subsp. abscessus]SID34943.1 Uncharacterised protein [Mycobacteroides abscessus subsp. abscessus]SID40627.1 Uncharacterised protein [Mycobacteroides abscessus subsp. abscessus]SKT66041.1 Uncharacterised protein [Mycobacteroides abscessus subsp. abscessus]